MNPSRTLFLLASSRRDGNSEWLARRAAEALPASSTHWLRLIDLEPDPYRDRREEQPRTPWPSGDSEILLRETLAADDLVFVTPLYWYGPATPLKHYLDHWSAWLRLDAVDFRAAMRGKRLWLICALSDSDTAKAEPLTAMLRLTAQYMGMTFAGALLGRGNRRGDVQSDDEALTAADKFFAPRQHRPALPGVVTESVAAIQLA